MKTKIMVVTAVILLVGLATANAELVTIDFEQLGSLGDGGYLGVSSYSEDGFTITTSSEFGYAKRKDTNSIVLFSRYGNDMINLTRDDEQIFDLLSIDFYPYIPLPEPIEFVATLIDNTTISQTFPGYEGNGTTVVFDDFRNIISVNWQVSGGYEDFDNITIIPEPSTLSLILLGGVIFRRFKL